MLLFVKTDLLLKGRKITREPAQVRPDHEKKSGFLPQWECVMLLKHITIGNDYDENSAGIYHCPCRITDRD